MIKRTAALILVFLFVLPLFAACSETEDQASSESAGTEASAPAVTAEEPAPSEEASVPQEEEPTAPEEEEYRVRYNNTWYRPRENLETVLLIGLDKYGDGITEPSYRNNRQSDFLLLCIIDRDRKTVSAIHLNRDCMADVPVLSVDGEVIGTKYEQLALSYTYGSGGQDSCRNTRLAVSGLLYGIPIDYYVSVTMDAVAVLNDSVGGVQVVIPEDMTPVDPEMVKGAAVKLTGEQALKFVRARTTLADGTNLSRMKRQKQYMLALAEKLVYTAKNDPRSLAAAAIRLAQYVITDYPPEQVLSAAQTLSGYTAGEIADLPGEAVRGEEYTEFYVDENALQKLLIDMMFVEDNVQK